MRILSAFLNPWVSANSKRQTLTCQWQYLSCYFRSLKSTQKRSQRISRMRLPSMLSSDVFWSHLVSRLKNITKILISPFLKKIRMTQNILLFYLHSFKYAISNYLHFSILSPILSYAISIYPSPKSRFGGKFYTHHCIHLDFKKRRDSLLFCAKFWGTRVK